MREFVVYITQEQQGRGPRVVAALLAHAAHVRGLVQPRIASVRAVVDLQQSAYCVQGEQVEEPGWDANGAPVDTWPVESLLARPE